VDDRCPDVLAGQRQGLVRLAAQLGVERGVVQRVGEFGRQAGLRQDGLEEGPGAAIPAIGPIGLGGGVETRAAELAGTGVTVNVLRPGMVDTALPAWIRAQPPEQWSGPR
jgi:hypothetical protein